MNPETPPSRITVQRGAESTRIEIRSPRIWLYIVPSAAAVSLCAWIFVLFLGDLIRGRVSLGGVFALLLSLGFVAGFSYVLLSLWAGSDVVVLAPGSVEVRYEVLGRSVLTPTTYASPVKEVRVADSRARSESEGFSQVEIDFEDGDGKWINNYLDKPEAELVAGEIRQWKARGNGRGP